MTAGMQRVLAGLAIVIVAGLLWVALVSPARDDAKAAQDAQAQAEGKAAAVAGQLATSKDAAKRTPANARTLKRLGVAVPEKVEAPALIDQLDRTAKRYGVSFDVLKVSDGAATAAPAAPAAGASTTGSPATTTTTPPAATGGAAGAPAAPAGSVPVQLNVELAGSYVAVTRFVKAVQADVRTSGGKRVSARGRLLRISTVELAADAQERGKGLKGTLSVVAYLLPKDSGTAAAAAPAGTTATPSTGSQP